MCCIYGANKLTEAVETVEGGGTLSRTDSYAYDRNGNNLMKVSGYITDKKEGEEETGISESSPYVTMYEYDSFGRLSKAEAGGKKAEYSYDGNGVRRSKTVEGKTTGYYMAGDQVINETENGALSASNIIAGGVIGRITGGTSYMMLKNDHGDVVGLTANGEVKADYTYSAYGELIADGSNGINNPIRYAGEYTDEESGLIYLRARYYDPGLGRFISEDTHWNPSNMIYGDNPEEEDKLNSVSNYNNGLKNESNKEKIVQSLLRKIKEINESKETVVQNQEDEVRNISLDSIMQSCNLYIYCLNNPITHIDPSGNGYSNIEISISRNGNSNQCQVYIHWTGEDMINAFSFDNLRINSLSLFGGRYSNIGGSFIRVPSSEVSTAGYVFVANVTIPNNVTAVRVTAIGLTGYTTYGYGVSILHTGIVKIN